jgi:hypothetical protein
MEPFGRDITHAHKNNPRSAHALLKLLYALIYMCLGVIFIYARNEN